MLMTRLLKKLKLRIFLVDRAAECCRNQSTPSMILMTTTSLQRKMTLFQQKSQDSEVKRNHSGKRKTLHFSFLRVGNRRE